MSGGSGGGGSSTTTQELPGWAQPYAEQLLQRGANLSNQSVPQYNGQMVAGLNDSQWAGINNTNAVANNASGIAGTANNFYQQLVGKGAPTVANPYTGNVTASTAADAYADPTNNPYLAKQVAAANQQITDQYSNVTAPTTLAQFRSSGAFGGSAQQQATAAQEKQLADSLSANTANMYGQAYNTAAGVASQNAAQQNQIAQGNQQLGTAANQYKSSQDSGNYFTNLQSIQQALAGASGANTAAGTAAANQITAGGVQQQNSQDQLNAAYQQWFNSVNQPYSQLSTLSSALSGALGSGAGTSMTSQQAGSGSTLGNILGLGQLGLGAYNAFSQ